MQWNVNSIFQWAGNMIVIAYRTNGTVRWNQHRFVAMRMARWIYIACFPILVSYENDRRNCSFHLAVIAYSCFMWAKHDERNGYNIIFPSVIDAIILPIYNIIRALQTVDELYLNLPIYFDSNQETYIAVRWFERLYKNNKIIVKNT